MTSQNFVLLQVLDNYNKMRGLSLFRNTDDFPMVFTIQLLALIAAMSGTSPLFQRRILFCWRSSGITHPDSGKANTRFPSCLQCSLIVVSITAELSWFFTYVLRIFTYTLTLKTLWKLKTFFSEILVSPFVYIYASKLNM